MSAAPAVGGQILDEMPTGPLDLEDGARQPVLPRDNEAEVLAWANGLLRKLDAVTEERGVMVDALRIEREQLERTYEARIAAYDRRIEALTADLEVLFTRLPLRGKERSRKLPCGTLGIRKQPALLIVEDEAALKAAADDGLDVIAACFEIVEKERLDKKALDKLWKEQGTVPPGCTVREESEVFFAKPNPGVGLHEST